MTDAAPTTTPAPTRTPPRGPSRSLLAMTLGALGVTPLLASWPSLWPAFVATSLVASGGLVLLWRRDALSTTQVLAGAVVLRLAFVPMLPVLSDDIFRYVWDGWIQVHGVNPYRYVPSDPALAAFRGDVFDALNSAEYYSVYPPFSQAVFALGGLTHDVLGWKGSYYVIKIALVTLEMGGVLLLARLTSARNLLLYAWNPLVLVTAAGQGHTEAAAVCWIVGTVWAVRAGRGRLASMVLAAATLVKLYPIVLGPFLVRRFGAKAVWPGVAVGVVFCAPYAAPYVLPHVHASVDLYVRLFEFNAGFYYSAKQALWALTGTDWSKTLGPLFRWTYLGTLPVLYVLDAWRGWCFRRAAMWALGLFFVLSTTVHPWYLLAILPLAVLGVDRPASGFAPAWAWLWLGAMSMGTYLLYVDGPYWTWVVVGWGGWALLGLGAWHTRLWDGVDAALQCVQRRRADAKAHRLRPHLAALAARSSSMRENGASFRILDLGAGEGYVADALATQLGADVTLADVVDMNRTPHALVRYDGRTLPFADDAFDATVLYFVLHHCACPERVLDEALRVSRRGVVVVESVYRTEAQRQLLSMLDRLANRVRSGGRMTAQEAHLAFRRADAWADLARSLGASVDAREDHGRWYHRQTTLRLTAPSISA